MRYQFWGWEHADAPAITEEYPGIHNPRQLYDALSKLWCADTCAPRMRKTGQGKTLPWGNVPLPLFLPRIFLEERYTEFCARAGIIIVIM